MDGKVAFEAKIKTSESEIKHLKRIAHNLKLKEYYIIKQDYYDFSRVIWLRIYNMESNSRKLITPQSFTPSLRVSAIL